MRSMTEGLLQRKNNPSGAIAPAPLAQGSRKANSLKHLYNASLQTKRKMCTSRRAPSVSHRVKPSPVGKVARRSAAVTDEGLMFVGTAQMRSVNKNDGTAGC